MISYVWRTTGMGKRMVYVLAAALLVLAGCGKNEEMHIAESERTQAHVQTESGQEADEQPKASDSRQITLELLLNTEEADPKDFLYSELTDGTLQIVEYLGDSAIVVIPDEIEGKEISVISSYVFANDSSAAAVKMPDSVTKLENYAFSNNQVLEMVVCGKNLEEIGTGCFMQCGNLQYVDIGNSVIKIGECAFVICPKLNDIYLPESVAEIDYSAFENDSNPSFTIQGAAGSYAEEYARERGITFEAK